MQAADLEQGRRAGRKAAGASIATPLLWGPPSGREALPALTLAVPQAGGRDHRKTRGWGAAPPPGRRPARQQGPYEGVKGWAAHVGCALHRNIPLASRRRAQAIDSAWPQGLEGQRSGLINQSMPCKATTSQSVLESQPRSPCTAAFTECSAAWPSAATSSQPLIAQSTRRRRWRLNGPTPDSRLSFDIGRSWAPPSPSHRHGSAPTTRPARRAPQPRGG